MCRFERFVVVGECFLVQRGWLVFWFFAANLSNIAFSSTLSLEQKILGKLQSMRDESCSEDFGLMVERSCELRIVIGDLIYVAAFCL